MSQVPYLTAKEVTAQLGISLGTLYSYVSRGLIRSEETEGASRRKRYLAEDVEALKQRKERRHNPAVVAATALDFGDPVLESAITLIHDGEFYYRGDEVIALVKKHNFEEIATLIWRDEPSNNPFAKMAGSSAMPLFSFYTTAKPLLRDLMAVEALQVLLPLAEAEDLAAHDLSTSGVIQTGARLMLLMVLAATGELPTGALAHHLQQHWAPALPQAASMLDAALILCADHELNASSFTARCVASTGSTPYSVVGAGLAALLGPKHGGDSLRCAAFLNEAMVHPRRAIVSRLKQGEHLPGFGHRLYPEGDPRGRYLVELILNTFPNAPITGTIRELIEEVQRNFGLRPTVDFGLAVLARALQLPSDAPLTLFALGRMAGWIGHAIEQYHIDRIIRPRAHYVGKDPES